MGSKNPININNFHSLLLLFPALEINKKAAPKGAALLPKKRDKENYLFGIAF
jgi:hypothetical protein